MEDGVEFASRGQIVSEGLFHDDAAISGASGAGEVLYNRGEQAGRDGQIMRGRLGTTQLLAQGSERGLVFIVTIDVTQKLH